jgi:hypothetical protein
MIDVKYLEYGAPDWGQSPYYQETKRFNSWALAQAFIRSLEDYEYISSSCILEEEEREIIPF